MPLQHLIAGDFEEFAHALVREALDYKDRGSSVGYVPTGRAYRADGKADAILPSGVFGRSTGSLPGLVLFSYKTTEAEDDKTARKNLRSHMLRDIEAQAAQNPAELVFLYNRELVKADFNAIRKKVAERFPVWFLGPSVLKSMADQRHKHIFWRWFRGSPFVRAEHCEDEAAVLEAFGIEVVPAGIAEAPRRFAQSELTEHRIRIVGAPGAGKSVLMSQIVMAHPGSLLIRVSPARSENLWSHLERMVFDAARPVVLAFSNFHEMCLRGDYGAFLDCLRSIVSARKTDVTILVEYRSTEADKVRQLISEEIWQDLGFGEEVNLDTPPIEFLAAVFNAACVHYEVSVSDGRGKVWLGEILKADNTPLAVVEWVSDYKGSSISDTNFSRMPTPLESVVNKWRSKFDAIVCHPERYVEVDFLQALSLRRLAGLPLVEDLEVWCRCTGKSEICPLLAAPSVEKLLHEGWFSRSHSESLFLVHDVRLLPLAVGLLEKTAGCSEMLYRYAQRLIKSPAFPERAAITEALGQLIMGCPVPHDKAQQQTHWRTAADLFAIADEDGEEVRHLKLREAVCRTHLEETLEAEEALGVLRKAAETEEKDTLPAVEYGRALLRCGRRQEASEEVRRLLLRGSIVPDANRLAAIHVLFEMLDLRGAVAVARDVIENPASSMSAKILAASSLAQAGFVHDAESVLLPLSEVPETPPKALLGLAFCYRHTRNSEEFVEHVRNLICQFPTEPDIRILFAEYVATLSGVNKNAELALEAVEKLDLAYKLRSHIPEFLANLSAIKGLLLLQLENREEADRLFYKSAHLGGPTDALVQSLMVVAMPSDEASGFLSAKRHYSKAQYRSDYFASWHPSSILEVANRLRDNGKWEPDCAIEEGATYGDIGLMKNAEEVFREALNIEPGHVRCSSLLAWILSDQSRFAEAAEILLLVRKLHSTTEKTSFEALFWVEAKRYTEALEPARIAMEENPPPSKEALVYATALYFAENDYESVTDILMAFPFAKISATDRWLLVSSLDASKRSDKALELALQTVNDLPKSTVLPDSLLFPILKFGTRSQVAEILSQLHGKQTELTPFAERIESLALSLESAELPDSALRLRELLVLELPDYQPARYPLVHSIVAAEQWDVALEIINRPSGAVLLRGGGGYAEMMVRICKELEILDHFLDSPESVLDKYDMADVLAVATAIHAHRYDRAIDLWAQLAADGWWFPHGGIAECPIPDEHEVGAKKAVDLWLRANPAHPGRIAICCLNARLQKARQSEYETILHEACEQWPESIMVLSEFCELIALQGNVDDLLTTAQRILDLKPENLLGQRHKAFALIGMGRTTEALQILEETIPQFAGLPHEAGLRALRAIALRDLYQDGEHRPTKDILEKAIDDARFARRNHAARPESLLAETACLLHLGEKEDALRVAVEGLTLFPENVRTVYGCAVAMAQNGRAEEICNIPGFDLRMLSSSSWMLAQVGSALAHHWARKHKTLKGGTHSFRKVFLLLDEGSKDARLDFANASSFLIASLYNASRQLNLEAEGLEILAERPEIHHSLPEYWEALASMQISLNKSVEAREAVRNLCAGVEPEEALGRAFLNTESANDCDSTNFSPDLAFLVINLQICEGRWECAVNTIANVLLRSVQSPGDALVWAELCVQALFAVPTGTPVTVEIAETCLATFLSFETLDTSSAENFISTLGKFDWVSTLEQTKSSPQICACLACLFSVPAVCAEPSLAVLATHADSILESLESHKNAPDLSPLVRHTIETLARRETC